MTTISSQQDFYVKCDKCNRLHALELSIMIAQPVPQAMLEFTLKATKKCNNTTVVNFPHIATICQFCERFRTCKSEPDDFPDCLTCPLAHTYIEQGLRYEE